ncbi:hypothetical protein DPQ25_08375 [Hydrogeniiclostridium mannosilyticum]|uniref:Uncharacterized protein n=1 Tax=Hydrogeniiclostridium mannosilyticum TaxID=2764322 RepID=A0A328UHV1_9FIRM|nr:hypothetical protein DPQ25_08375 [Hydrogeniiclostridium mannosilyticum]
MRIHPKPLNLFGCKTAPFIIMIPKKRSIVLCSLPEGPGSAQAGRRNSLFVRLSHRVCFV